MWLELCPDLTTGLLSTEKKLRQTMVNVTFMTGSVYFP